MKTIIAIDPGLSGAIAFIRGGTSSVIDTPVLTIKKGKTKRRYYDEPAIRSLFMNEMNAEGVFAILEQQQPFPGQGGVSNYSTGFGFGLFKGLLTGLGIPFETVHPKTWQKMFFKGKGGETKALSYQIASQLYPDLEFITPRGRKIDGRSDAILLAEYGRRIGV